MSNHDFKLVQGRLTALISIILNQTMILSHIFKEKAIMCSGVHFSYIKQVYVCLFVCLVWAWILKSSNGSSIVFRDLASSPRD